MPRAATYFYNSYNNCNLPLCWFSWSWHKLLVRLQFVFFCLRTTKNKRNNACILKVKSCLLFLFILSSLLNASPYSRNIYFLYLLGITFFLQMCWKYGLPSLHSLILLLQPRHTDKKSFLRDFHSSDLQCSYISLGLSISFHLSFLMKFTFKEKCLLLPRFHCCLYAYEYVKR